MRVLWFTDVRPAPVRRTLGLSPDPGPQAWVDCLAEQLALRDDVSLTIASPSDQPYSTFTDGGITYHCIWAPRHRSRLRRIADDWRHRLTSAETLSAAEELIERIRPDIMHVHGTESVFGAVAVRSTEAPCVVSLQGLLRQYQRFYFSGRRPSEIVRLAATVEVLKGRGVLHGYSYLRAMADGEADVMRHGRWFIGRTDWDRASLAAVNPTAVYYHCDEIMRKEFYGTRWTPRPDGRARIYSTSSAMLFKGTETLIESAGLLARQGVRDLTVGVAGVPPGSQVDSLYRRTAHRFNVEHLVEWLGRLDAPAIVTELEAASLFVYPSRIDNSPNALVEAMLCGLPIVATFTGGIPSLLEHGREGLLVPRGDAAALAAASLRVLRNPGFAAQLGEAARRRALERNDQSAIARRTVDIYRDITAAC